MKVSPKLMICILPFATLHITLVSQGRDRANLK